MLNLCIISLQEHESFLTSFFLLAYLFCDMLVGSERSADIEHEKYSTWLQNIISTCVSFLIFLFLLSERLANQRREQ